MAQQILFYAIPVFFVLIFIEVAAARWLSKPYYRYTDAVNDLSMGIIDQVGGVFLKLFTGVIYVLLWKHFRIFDLGSSKAFGGEGIAPWVWISGFVVLDICYYWAHRMCHEMNLGWATHIAHHQSEEYNLAVALRQGVFQALFTQFFYLPMAILGYPPVVMAVCAILSLLYQFWIHTRVIKRLGPLEYILNTPSHHRVHHGRDEKYIDKNHTGTFIWWDMIFGTFQKEEEEPHYGVVTPLRSWNPLWAQVHYLVRLVRLSVSAPRWRDKLLVWVMPPAWLPQGMTPKSAAETRDPDYRLYDPPVPRGLALYTGIHFAVTGLAGVLFLVRADAMGWGERAAAATFVFVGLAAFGAIHEGRRWALWVETFRLTVLGTGMYLAGREAFGLSTLSFHGAATAAAFLAVVSAAMLWRRRGHFSKPAWVRLDSAGHVPAVPAPTAPPKQPQLI